MYAFMRPGYYDGTRRVDDLDGCGISSYEREGMEAIKQEVLKRWACLDEASSALQQWEDAELKLQVFTGQIAN